MGSAAAAIEISSDDEDGWRTPVGAGKHPPDGGWRTPGASKDKPSNDGLEWAKKLLDDDCVAIGEGSEDSAEMQEVWAALLDETDVVVDVKNSLVGEPEKKKLRDGDDDDDDDCVILDGDPEKAVAVVAKGDEPRGDAMEDELQIVAEKGELACRDFPHPRHLCASLGFSTTSHARHCTMCHCYVCDSLAPCAYWGKGTGINDHCHATDKDVKWKKLRQLSKCKGQQTPKLVGIQNLLQSSSTSANVMIPSTGRFPVSSTVSQMQQMHPSITVSRNMGQGILPRATSPMPRTTIRSSRSKRARVAPPVYTPSNVNHMQPSVPSYSPMRPALPRGYQTAAVPPGGTFVSLPSLPPSAPPPVSAPKGSQRCQVQPSRYPQAPPNTVVGTGVPLSRYSSLSAQGKQQPQGPLTETNRLWRAALTNLAYELGVPDYNINPQPAGGQQSRTQTLHANQLPAEAEGGRINPNCSGQAASRKRLSIMHNSSNHAATGSTAISSHTIQTKQPFCQLNSESSVVPNETILTTVDRSPMER